MNFWTMGGYAGFVWPAYGVSALGLVFATLWTLNAYRQAKTKLKSLEGTSQSGAHLESRRSAC